MTPSVRPFTDLDARARAALWAWFDARQPGQHADVAALEAQAGSLIFEDARTFLTAWRGAAPAGTLGVVLREIGPKGLCYLTSAAAEDLEALDTLVGGARALVPAGHAPELRLATGPETAYVGNLSTSLGFIPGARTLELSRPVTAGTRAAARMTEEPRANARLAPIPAGPALTLHPLTPARFADYLAVSNAAFAATPSGATLAAADLALMRDAQPEPAFLGVGYADGQPVAAWSLARAARDGAKAQGEGEVAYEVDDEAVDGVIEALAVLPAAQGRGYGRTLLAHAHDVLAASGATRLVLTVGDGNHGALALYRKAGFGDERVVTQWHARRWSDP